ncbi:hypothetical protein AAFF_G00012840 [Aldrovandia affinis]|uniref:Uncharacterized protein n=1 Tax=Aldrovandia affinis TaxID=143900 RepID=A0AAD7S6N7_9TELE|nr:hypothetical protein AAFF_G00012840 [Aldrovandia affinis]
MSAVCTNRRRDHIPVPRQGTTEITREVLRDYIRMRANNEPVNDASPTARASLSIAARAEGGSPSAAGGTVLIKPCDCKTRALQRCSRAASASVPRGQECHTQQGGGGD